MELSPGLSRESGTWDLGWWALPTPGPHGPCWVRFVVLGEDIVPRIGSCFQPFTHQQANVNMVTGRSDL